MILIEKCFNAYKVVFITQQVHNIKMTLYQRRCDVDTTSF